MIHLINSKKERFQWFRLLSLILVFPSRIFILKEVKWLRRKWKRISPKKRFHSERWGFERVGCSHCELNDCVSLNKNWWFWLKTLKRETKMSTKWPNQANRISILMRFIIFCSHQNSLLCIKIWLFDTIKSGIQKQIVQFFTCLLFEVSIFQESHVSIICTTVCNCYGWSVIEYIVVKRWIIRIEIEYISSGGLDVPLCDSLQINIQWNNQANENTKSVNFVIISTMESVTSLNKTDLSEINEDCRNIWTNARRTFNHSHSEEKLFLTQFLFMCKANQKWLQKLWTLILHTEHFHGFNDIVNITCKQI